MRVYLDGCCDLLHYGHANAMRQARQLGSSLTVGVISDECISQYKVPPVLTLAERCELAESVRWVDAVVPGVPHILDDAFTWTLINVHGIGLVVHGDGEDTLMPDGEDAYRGPKNAGIYWVVPRTTGISTTDLVRALLTNSRVPAGMPSPQPVPSWQPGKDADAVYVDGAFDCLHVGHIAFFKQARKYGKRLVAGVHEDEVVLARRGALPVMSMPDRVRTLLECKYVDGVITEAPEVLTLEFLRSAGAICVARGAVHESTGPERHRYVDVSQKLVSVMSDSDVTLATLRKRILDNQDAYARKVYGS